MTTQLSPLVLLIALLPLVAEAEGVRQLGAADGAAYSAPGVPRRAGGVFLSAENSELWRLDPGVVDTPAVKGRLHPRWAPRTIRPSDDGRLVAAIVAGELVLVDPVTLAVLARKRGSPWSEDGALALSPDGSMLAYAWQPRAREHMSIGLFDARTMKKLREGRLETQPDELTLEFAADGRSLVLRAYPPLVIDVETLRAVELRPSLPASCVPRQTPTPRLDALVVHPTRPVVAVAWIDNHLGCADGRSTVQWVEQRSLPDLLPAGPDLTIGEKVTALSYIAEGRLLALGDRMGFVHLVETSTGQRLEKFPVFARGNLDQPVKRLLWDPASNTLLAEQYRVKFFDLGDFVRGAQPTAAGPETGCLIGQCVDGEGRLRLADGSVLEGTFVAGKLEGKGNRHTRANGAVYEGAYRNGLRHGKGTFTEPGKGTYIGEWKDDLRHGDGTIDVPGRLRLRGDFHDDRLLSATITWENGDRYSGELRDLVPHGIGRYRFANGDSYQGPFEAGRFEGFGTFREAGGDEYRGLFSKGERNGGFTVTRKDGSKESINYVSGVRHVPQVRTVVTVTPAQPTAPRRKTSSEEWYEYLNSIEVEEAPTETSCGYSGKYTPCGRECCGTGYVCCAWGAGAVRTCRPNCNGWGWR